MTEAKEEEILSELRRITRLLSLLATKDQTQKDQIATLSAIGFQPKEIAELLGTSANTVRVALVEIRKRAKTGGKSRSRKKVKGKGTDDKQGTP